MLTCYEQTIGQRRTLGHDPAAAAGRAAQAEGRTPRVSERAALAGIIFVLKTGIPWELLPQETGCGSEVTCWRRLRDWQDAGVWERLDAGLAGFSECTPKKEGDETGINPTDKGKPGTKRHIVVDRGGIPLVSHLSGANRHDSMLFERLVRAIPPITAVRGGRRKRPEKLHADKASDIPRCRQFLGRRGIKCRIARKGISSDHAACIC